MFLALRTGFRVSHKDIVEALIDAGVQVCTENTVRAIILSPAGIYSHENPTELIILHGRFLEILRLNLH